MFLVHVMDVGIDVALGCELVEVLLLGATLAEHLFAHRVQSDLVLPILLVDWL